MKCGEFGELTLLTSFYVFSDRIKYTGQAYELTVLLRRAFEALPNLESFNIDCIFAPAEGSLEILNTLRLPALRTFRIQMDSAHAPTLVDFLSNHPHLKDIELITDGYGSEEPDVELIWTELERFTAPFTYWELVQPTPTLHCAGIHQDWFKNLVEDPLDVISPLERFTGIRSVKIVVPAEETLPYLLYLKEVLPTLEELSVDFSNWLDHGEETVSLHCSLRYPRRLVMDMALTAIRVYDLATLLNTC